MGSASTPLAKDTTLVTISEVIARIWTNLEKGGRRRQNTRQARRLDQLIFQIWDYRQETFGERYEEYFGWWEYEDPEMDEFYWDSDSNSDSDSELEWLVDMYSDWDGDYYLPGRDEYEYMNVELCPLCGGNCMYRVKKEAMEDLDEIKWRDPFFSIV
jgi:hypothetical protein